MSKFVKLSSSTKGTTSKGKSLIINACVGFIPIIVSNIFHVFHFSVINQSSKYVSTGHLSNSTRDLERWGNSLYLPKLYTTWRCSNVEAMCIIGFGIMAHHTNTHAKDRQIGVSVVMMWHGFILLITYHMAWLLNYFDVCPKQLPPMVLLVYERAKLLEIYFQVRFGFEKILSILHVTKVISNYSPYLMGWWAKFYQSFHWCARWLMHGTFKLTW